MVTATHQTLVNDRAIGVAESAVKEFEVAILLKSLIKKLSSSQLMAVLLDEENASCLYSQMWVEVKSN